MRYISTFTGIGGFEIAIENVFEKSLCLGYSEKDKHAIATYEKNFREHKYKNFGDIVEVVFHKDEKGDILLDEKGEPVVNVKRVELLPDIDLLVGGPPCQDLSIAKGNRKGLDGSKSRLFFAFLAILKIKKPKYFLMENVASMSNENRDRISELLGVQPEKINADIFVAQKRIRNYWFNWDMPELSPGPGKRIDCLVAWSRSTRYKDDETGKIISSPGPGRTCYVEQREIRDGRANTLTTGKGCGSFSSKNYLDPGGVFVKRILTPIECEQIQGLPHDWTAGVSDTQRFRQIGNAVIPAVIEHILKGIK